MRCIKVILSLIILVQADSIFGQTDASITLLQDKYQHANWKKHEFHVSKNSEFHDTSYVEIIRLGDTVYIGEGDFHRSFKLKDRIIDQNYEDSSLFLMGSYALNAEELEDKPADSVFRQLEFVANQIEQNSEFNLSQTEHTDSMLVYYDSVSGNPYRIEIQGYLASAADPGDIEVYYITYELLDKNSNKEEIQKLFSSLCPINSDGQLKKIYNSNWDIQIFDSYK